MFRIQIALTAAALALVSTACGIDTKRTATRTQPRAEALQHEDEPSEEPIDEPVAPVASTRLISDVTTRMTITLDETTVLCSAADYSATFLKILIPQVADVTLFDHRNTAVDAPCIAAGECTDELNPQTILDPYVTTEDIDLRIVLTSDAVPHPETETCTVTLTEQLFTTIRGVPFFHQRDGLISERNLADCPNG